MYKYNWYIKYKIQRHIWRTKKISEVFVLYKQVGSVEYKKIVPWSIPFLYNKLRLFNVRTEKYCFMHEKMLWTLIRIHYPTKHLEKLPVHLQQHNNPSTPYFPNMILCKIYFVHNSSSLKIYDKWREKYCSHADNRHNKIWLFSFLLRVLLDNTFIDDNKSQSANLLC